MALRWGIRNQQEAGLAVFIITHRKITACFLAVYLCALISSGCASGKNKVQAQQPSLAAPDPDRAALTGMEKQASKLAQQQAPGAVLHQIDTDLLWTIFRFTDAGATEEIAIRVDTPQTPAAQWKTDVTSFSKLVGSLGPGPDLSGLKAGPGRAAKAVQSHWPGCTLHGLTLYLQDQRRPWVAFCTTAAGIVTGLVDNQTGVFQPSEAPPAEFPVTATPQP